jgi:two-component system nitrogen regulation response regulator NtrX
MALELLIVDDEVDIREIMSDILRDEGYDCREAGNSAGALQAIEERIPNLVILDIWLEGGEKEGLETLEVIARNHPGLPVVMISGHGDIETAVSAIKMGAYDFIEKPFKAERLLFLVERAIDAARLKRENRELRLRAGGETALVGVSPVIKQLSNAIDRVAPTESRVFISGPPGAGKEVVARLLHEKSQRANDPFVLLNCATMAPDRMEIEMFGTEQSPTDPDRPRVVGTFEQAHGGTLLLDEVADMPLETQGKIVRVLQDQTFQRIGGTTTVEVNVRVIATSNRDLDAEMQAGNFRQDLFYRLSVVPISVPSLVSRREDIPPLVRHFMEQSAKSAGLAPRRIAEDTMAALQAYYWPGNVRQLRNVVDWILIMASGPAGDAVRADMLPPEFHDGALPTMNQGEASEVMGMPLRDAREVFERQYLTAQVSRFGGNISRTAAFVGMERSALHRKLKSLGVPSGNRAENRSA